MRPFRFYALNAALIALVATIVSTQFAGLLDSAMDVYAIAIVPIVFAILISGNAHSPSEFGLYVGFFLEWLIICLVVATILWAIKRRRRRVAT
jgi:hypothetical protein